MPKQSLHTRNIDRFLTTNLVQVTDKFRKILKFWWLTLIESVPFLLACAVFLSVVSLKSPFLLFCLLAGSLIVIVIQQIGQQSHLPKRWLIICQILAVAMIMSLFWLDYFAAPAQAQFFKRAEDFFRTTLTEGASSNNNSQAAVSLIFNVLRAIYLLYIAVALIGVINAVRKDEDWQSIARTPLLVVVAVTVADVLTGFIIGDGNK
ncbi:hypothetical protein [Anabaena sp. UHCC 0399]|uniref:hypothetical protein n=1 Tax=Anabaena sp. UHCC 0399 TaxID=3110238 RepID=UPI002B21534B|nr:hypothetical protein [Anabaena sp. UHCC 0399]MEA5564523.1 hypothetical protein [Anabaena sp. UHCC 0399]